MEYLISFFLIFNNFNTHTCVENQTIKNLCEIYQWFFFLKCCDMAWLGKCVSNSNTGDIRKICDERIGIPVMGGWGVGLRGGWVGVEQAC